MCTCMRVCVCAQSLQSCPTLCDPMASSPPGFFVHGILLARKLEWVAISSFRGYSWLRDRICVSYVSCIGWQVFFLSLTLPGKPYTHIYMCIHIYVCVHAKLLQSCPTLCDPMDYSAPGSSVHGILQARILEWVAMSFSRGSSWPGDQTRVSSIAGSFFIVWTTREAHIYVYTYT